MPARLGRTESSSQLQAADDRRVSEGPPSSSNLGGAMGRARRFRRTVPNAPGFEDGSYSYCCGGFG